MFEMYGHLIRKAFSRGSISWVRGSGRVLWLTAGSYFICALYAFGLLAQGLDVTDSGFHLTRAWMELHGDPEKTGMMTWLTNKVAAFWLAIGDDSGLLWARTGWAAVIGLAGAGSFSVLRLFHRPAPALGLTLLTAMAIIFHGNNVIEYNDFPASILIVAVAASIHAFVRIATGSERIVGLSFTSGILFGVTFLARFPTILAILLPVLCFVFAVVFIHSDRKNFYVYVKWAYLGWFSAVALGVIVMIVNGEFGSYWSLVVERLFHSSPQYHHSPHALSSLYQKGISTLYEWTVDSFLIAGLPVLVLAVLSRVKVVRRRLPVSPVAAAAGAVWIVFSYVTRYQFEFHPFFYILPGVVFSFAVSALVILAVERRGGEQGRYWMLTILVALAASVLVFPGSAAGWPVVRHGLWLVLPLVLVSVWWRRGAGVASRVMGIFGIAVLFGVAAIGACIRWQNPYRDLQDRTSLTAGLEYPRLMGITTSPGRAGSLMELLVELEQRVAPGGYLLAYSSIPLVHYLTQTKPALGHSWPSLLASEELIERLKAVENSGALPLVVVRAVADTHLRDWGAVPTATCTHEGRNLRILDDWVRRSGYREVWKNRDFSIAVRE